MPRYLLGGALTLVLALAGVSPATAGAPSSVVSDTARRGLPLAPARWARFTATEGTWISLDVSPDGQRIVFDLVGDLYTMPITGGRATRLTSGMAHDMQPRFSPDGRRIVFVSDESGDENLHLINADGTDAHQLTVGDEMVYFSPDWTPDGEYVVVSRGGIFSNDRLWMVHANGGRGLPLGDSPGGTRTLGPSMTPDGRYVWFAQRQGAWQYNAILPQYQIGVYDRNTGGRTVMSGRYGSAFRPAVSPDGRWVAYGSRHDAETGLRVRELATGEERWLAYPIQRDDQESVASLDVLPGYSWTPDSRAIVMSYGGKIWRVAADGSGATEIPFSAEAEVAVGPEVKFEYPIEDTPTFELRQIRDAVPSPNGRQMVFTALDRLYIMDLPNGTPRRLTNQETGEYYPTWSPDGQSIAYVTW
ncbi:MAG: amidohydrolase, partial [Actinomycetota bacterium]|nr:amidohydrolase [Actinomycetota bacterium]